MADGTKNILTGVVIVVVGALLGSFIGGVIGHAFPDNVLDFSKIERGQKQYRLEPTQLDLRVVEVTFGCLLKFNVPSVIGIFLSAYLFRSFFK